MTNKLKKFLCHFLSVSLIATSPGMAWAEGYTVRVPIAPEVHAPARVDYDFGQVIVGSTVQRVLAFTNRGSEPTTISGVQALGNAKVVTNGCAGTLEPARSCAVTAALQVPALGQNAGEIQVFHSTAALPDVFGLSATGVVPAAALQISPALLEFGDRAVGQVGSAKTFSITNVSDTPTEVLDIRLKTASSSYKINYDDCMVLLEKDMSCTVSVAYTPSSTGLSQNALDIELDDGSVVTGPTLTGSGVAGQATWSASQLNFLGVAVGQWSATQSVTLSNTGKGTLGLAKLELTGSAEFAIDSKTCGTSLAAGASCSVAIKVKPMSTDVQTGSLRLTMTNGSSVASAIQLYAQPKVDAPELGLSAQTVDFGDIVVGSSATRTVTFRSTGNSPVIVGGYALGGSRAADYQVVNGAECTGTLAPGMECALQLKATATQRGIFGATLTYSTNLPTPAMPVGLTANGIAGQLQASPAILAFGTVEVGQNKVLTTTLTNIGQAPLTINTLTMNNAGAGYTLSGCTGQALPINGTCTLTVTFAPSAAGDKPVTLSIGHTGLPSPATINFTGRGELPPDPVANLSAFTCPSPLETGVPVSCTAVLSNPGTVPLTVGALSRTGTSFGVPTSNCATSLAVGQSCTISLPGTFAAAGTYTSDVTVQTGAGAKTVTATAVASAPAIALSAQPHGTVQVGNNASATHTVTNTSPFTVSLSLPATLSGSAASQFAVTGTSCASSLAPSASCTVTTRCAPTSAGALAATLTVSGVKVSAAQALSCTGQLPPPDAADILVTPNPVDWGNVPHDSGNRSKTFTIQNNTGQALTAFTVSTSNISGTNANRFSVTSGSCPALAAGASCTVSVNGVAATAGLNTASVSIAIPGVVGTVTPAALRMNVVPGALTLNPARLDFGSVTVDSTKSLAVTLTNSTITPVSVTSFTLDKASVPYTVSHNCGTAVAANSSCAATVVFAPKTQGVAPAVNLRIVAATGTTNVPLTGTGQAKPVPGATLSALTCPSVVAAGSTATCTATLTSTGTAAVALTGYTVSNTGFTTKSSTCGTSLAPGATCTYSMTGTFASASTQNVTLTANTDVGNLTSSGTFTVTVLGFTLTPVTTHGAVTLGNSANATYRVTNTSQLPVPLTLPQALLGVDAGQYAIASTTCSTSVPPSGTCDVVVRCTPTAIGTLAASLVQASPSLASRSVALACAGAVGAPKASEISITPNPLDFGDVAWSTSANKTLVIRNNSLATIPAFSVTSAAISGTSANRFEMATTNCASLAPGASCTLTVTGNGTSFGLNTASLAIAIPTVVGTLSPVALRMNVVRGTLTASPSTVDFGNVPVNTSVVKTITLTTGSAAPVNISSIALTSTSTPYTLTHNCAAFRPVGSSCTVTVTVAPTALGTVPATAVRIVHNGQGGQLDVPLTTQAVAAPTPDASLSLTCASPIQAGAATMCVGTLTSTGTATLNPSTYDFSLAVLTNRWTTCGASLAPGASCEYRGTGVLTKAGNQSVTLSVVTNAGTKTANATIEVLAPQMSLVMKDHGMVQQGSPVSVQHTLTNNGISPVKVNTNLSGTTTVYPSVSGTGFSYVSHSCPTTLDSGQSCTITTRCNATLTGNFAGTLSVGFQGGTATGELTCSVQGPSAKVTREGGQTTHVGGHSRSGNWYRLTNTGVGPITVTSFTMANTNWTAYYNTADISNCKPNMVLQGGQSCLFMEILSKATPGQGYSGTHRVRTTAGDHAWDSTIQVSGVTITPVTGLPTQVQNGSTYDLQYRVTNVAPQALSNGQVSINGTGFSITSNTCASIAAGGSCLVNVRYVAPASGTGVSGSMAVTGAYPQVINGGSYPSVSSGTQGTFTWAGSTLTAPKVTITPGTYPAIRAGQTANATHTVRNEGVGPVTLGTPYLGVGSAHTLVSTTCGATLNVGSNCTVTTRYAPTSTVGRTTTLYAPYNAMIASAVITGLLILPSDVSVSVTSSPVSDTLQNSAIRYTITVVNGVAGPATVSVSFGAAASAGASIASRSAAICSAASPTCVVSGNVATMTLNASQGMTLTQTVTAGSGLGVITMTASATPSGVDDQNMANNTASKAVNVVNPLADLGISISGISSQVSTGGTGTATVTVRNNSTVGGPSAAGTNFAVTFTSSSGGGSLSLGTPSCTTAGTGNSCNASGYSGYLTPGGTATFMVPYTASVASGTYSLTGTVAVTSAGVIDSVPSNNKATVNTTIKDFPTEKRCAFSSAKTEIFTGPTEGHGASCSLGFTTSLWYSNWLSPYLFDGATTQTKSFACMGTTATAQYWGLGASVQWKGTGVGVTPIIKGGYGYNYIPISQVYVGGQWKDDPWAWYTVKGYTAPHASALFYCSDSSNHGCNGAVGRTVRATQSQSVYPQSTYWGWGGGSSNGRFVTNGTAKDGSQWRQTWIEKSPGPNCAAPGTVKVTPPSGTKFPIATEYGIWSTTN